jgi:hypothetical protein
VRDPDQTVAPTFREGEALERRIGRYRLVEDIAIAPGAELLRAEDPEGRRVLMQIVRCTGPSNSREFPDWQETLRRVASSTHELIANRRVGIIDHGCVERESGGSAIFWALPWESDLWRIGQARDLIGSVEHLMHVAVVLADLLDQRHRSGWIEMLLSEYTIIAGERTALIGAPVYIDKRWLAPDFLPARLAPEETLRPYPTRMGDLWRLGMTLESLGHGRDLPRPLADCIAWMKEPDPFRRPSSARAVLERLRSIRTGIERKADEEAFVDEEPTWIKLRAG